MKMNLLNHKIFFTPVIGFVPGINNPFGSGMGSGSQQWENITIEYNFNERAKGSRFFSLLQASAGFDFKIFKSLYVGVSINYYKGLTSLTKVDIEYTVNKTITENGNTINDGDFWNINLGVKYPISNYWQK
jgi:hypothetical protein